MVSKKTSVDLDIIKSEISSGRFKHQTELTTDENKDDKKVNMVTGTDLVAMITCVFRNQLIVDDAAPVTAMYNGNKLNPDDAAFFF